MNDIDVSEESIRLFDSELLDILLIDRTTRKNIIWATSDYSSNGIGFDEQDEITPDLVTGVYADLIQPRIAKSQNAQSGRTRDKAEVFTPSRWFAGGKGLDDFRTSMLNDDRLSFIVDYVDNSVLFKNVAIVGGVNYFLWNAKHHGDCEVVSLRGNHISSMVRNLNEYDIFIRNNESVQIMKRIENSGDDMMVNHVYPRNVFGISSDIRGQEDKDEDHNIALFCSQKSNSMAVTWITQNDIPKQQDLISKYKVIIGKVVPRGGEVGVDPSIGYRVISTVQVLTPPSAFTDSYLLLSEFSTKEEAVNFAEYMTLKFPRFMLHETYSSMNISKSNFRFVPLLDYTHKWTDEMLYKRYGCSQDEIDMIESMMRPLEFVVNEL